jgi:hypothetical protein
MPKTPFRALLPLLLTLAPTVAGAADIRVTATPAIATSATSERVSLSEALAPAFRAVPVGGRLRLRDWPIGPGRRATAELTRNDIYAADARLYVVDEQGVREVPRSRWLLFAGDALDTGGSHWALAVAFDPDTQTLQAQSWAGSLRYELTPVAGQRSAHQVAVAEVAAHVECEQGAAQEPFDLSRLGLPDKRVPELTDIPTTNAISTLHTATVAADLDNEVMAQKFSNNSTTATNFMAALFNAMNVMYERDLLVRLVQGTTFYRTAADPYALPNGDTTFNKLVEFGNYWSVNNGGVTRALAMMFSGRQTRPRAAPAGRESPG